MQEVAILFLGHGNTLQNQHNRPARRAHINWLVRCIQHQYRRMQGMHVAILMDTDPHAKDGRGNSMPTAISRIVPVRHAHDAFAMDAPGG